MRNLIRDLYLHKALMIERRIVFPREALLAFMIANIDLTQWLKEMVEKHSKGIKIGVIGPFGEAYPSGSLYPVFELKAEDQREEVLDELELVIDSKVYGLVNSLTERERIVLKKRVEERKSLAQIALDLSIKPQSVVSFINSIKDKVGKTLLRS
jgi:DNA-directed RNA polymerase specialized sigma subunit